MLPITFSLQAVSAAFEFRGITGGATTLSLRAVSAPFIQVTTYQTINATVHWRK